MLKRRPWSFQISDLIQWYEQQTISLSPKYQRNSVWNEKAKSYLIDTIIRGLPIPPIFLRQKVDITTKTTFREIIDGQQRIRTITEYISDMFPIKKTHNKEYGGKYFSELDPDVQEEFLSYQVSAEIVIENDDSVVYDMFARLNSNNVVLNKQEIRNAKFWGEFKVLVYNLASIHREFFLTQNLLSDKDCARMKDSELISSMLIVILDGIVDEGTNYVDTVYEKYDQQFDCEDEVELKFSVVMGLLKEIYSYFNSNIGCFGNKNYFFTLFCVLYNQIYGISNYSLKREDIFSDNQINNNKEELFSRISQFIRDFEFNTDELNIDSPYYASFNEFMNHHSLRTTNKTERCSRISFLNNYIVKQ